MKNYDVIVVGAGPAGMEAALTASMRGLRVVLIDEQDQPGGQYFRALPAAVADPIVASPEQMKDGKALRLRLADSAVDCVFQQKVWSARHLVDDKFIVDSVGPEGPMGWTARTLIVATGTTERVIPFDGWTKPGVMGLAAASILLKAHQMLPGHRTVVAGAGPLLAMVAASILRSGGEIAAIINAGRSSDWLSALPSLITRPSQLRLGAAWLYAIRRAGIPILNGHVVVAANGEPVLNNVVARPIAHSGAPSDGGNLTRFEADALVIGHGLSPATELPRLLGARLDYRPEAGGWIPECDADMMTSVVGLFVAGDCAGVAGALPARLRGQLAGLAAAAHAARSSRPPTGAAETRKALARAERFGRASARLMSFPDKAAEDVSSNQVICRCEGTILAEIDRALDEGARELNQLKIWTGCALGVCQGRYCSEFLEWRLRHRVGNSSTPSVRALKARPPVRSLPVEMLIGPEDGKPLNLPQKRP